MVHVLKDTARPPHQSLSRDLHPSTQEGNDCQQGATARRSDPSFCDSSSKTYLHLCLDNDLGHISPSSPPIPQHSQYRYASMSTQSKDTRIPIQKYRTSHSLRRSRTISTTWLHFIAFVLFSCLIGVTSGLPSHLFLSPVNGITGVGLTESLTMTFSEAVTAQAGMTIKIVVYNTEVIYESIQVTGPLVAGSGTATITITPSIPRQEHTRYYVTVDTGAFIGPTGAYPGITARSVWSWTTADFTPPSVTSLTPANGATNVDPGNQLTMSFNENVKAFTSSSAQITVKRSTDSTVLCSIGCQASSNFLGSGTSTIALVCPSRLPDLTSMVVEVPNLCLSDLSDNAFVFVGSWQFTTGDYTAPTVVSFNPTNLAANVPLTQTLGITFNENVVTGAGSITIRRYSDNTIIHTIVATSGNVGGGGTSTISITPPTPLPDSTRLFIEIANNAFRDATNNNPYAGISGSSTWSFTTVDTTPPTALSRVPAHGSESASTTGNLVIKFTERVNRVGGTIQIRTLIGDTLAQSINVMSSQVQDSGTDTIRIFLSAPLQDLQSYWIFIPATAFQDTSGNFFAGYQTNAGWNFRTGDFTPPLLQTVTPVHGATNVEQAVTISLTFNEAVKNNTGQIKLRRVDTQAEIASIDASQLQGTGTTTITIPHALLPQSTQITVEVPPGIITDMSNNAFAGIAVNAWAFTIGDFTPPSIVSYNPARMSRNVPRTGPIVATFNEPIEVIPGTIAHLVYASGVLQSFMLNDTSRVTVSGNMLSLLPNPILPDETLMWVILPASSVIDTSINKNAFAGLTSSEHWNFTSADITPPHILSLVPAANSSGVRTNATLTMVFTEAVQTYTSGSISIYRKSDNTLLRSVVASSSSVLGSGTSTLSIPFNDIHLPINTEVYALIDPLAISDLAVPANFFAGYQARYQWPWTTGDWVDPTVVSFAPPTFSENVPVSTSLNITFSKPVFARSGGRIFLNLLSNGAPIEAFVLPHTRVNFTGAIVTITPSVPLTSESWYYITITDDAIMDISTNRYAGIPTSDNSTWRFKAADINPPTLILTVPSFGATNVSTATPITITFSEPVTNVVNGGSVLLYRSNDNVLEYNISASLFSGLGTSAVTYQPIPALRSVTQYYVLINNNAFADFSGNRYAGIAASTVWTFSTRDDQPPSIIALTPGNRTTGVPLTTSLALTFDEITYARTGNLLVRRVSDSTVVANINMENTAAIQGSGTAIITVLLGVTLPAATELYVIFPSTAFSDAQNNFHPGFISPSTWTFTTYDNLPPVVTSLVPANNSVGVGLNDPLGITFNKPVTTSSGTGFIELRRFSDGSILEEWPISSTNITGSGTSTLTITRSVTLVDLTKHYVVIPNSAIRDMNGNIFPGLGLHNINEWTFTTGDLTPPYHTILSPTNGATRVAIDTKLRITFSKVVRPRTSGGLFMTVYRYSDDAQLAQIDVSSPTAIEGANTQVITATLPTTLPEFTQVYVIVSPGAFEDTSGRPYAGITTKTVWSFTTIDLTPPIVATFNPIVGSTGVPVNTALVLTFSEVVFTAPDGVGTMTIYRSTDNFLIQQIVVGPTSTATISGNGTNVITVTLPSHLPSTTQMYVLISSNAFVDRGGNAYAGTTLATQWYFTTADNTPPVILAVSPREESIGASPNTHLVVVFNEAVDYGPGLLRLIRWSDNSTVLSMSISASSGQIVQTTFAGQHTVDITTNVVLDDSTMYYVLIGPDAFKDLVGNWFEGITSALRWRFTTGDFTPPSIIEYTPARLSLTASPLGPARLNFTEPIVLATGLRIEIRRADNDALVEPFIAPTGALTVSGNVLTIAHARLNDLTDYYILVSANGIRDIAGNTFAGLLDKSAWPFRTADATPPQIVQLVPSVGATGVTATPQLSMTFNEPVTLTGPGNVTLYHNNGTIIEQFPVPSLRVVLAGGSTSGPVVNVITSAILSDFTRYYVTIDANTFPDLWGNYYQGILTPSTWYFDTGDNTPPILVSSQPAHQAINAPVAVTSPLVLTFSEVVYPRAGALSIYMVQTGALQDTISLTSAQVTGGGSTSLYFTLSRSLLEGTEYFILLPNNAISDSSNNYFAGFLTSTSYTFTTGYFSPPQVVSYSPLIGATNVPVNSPLILTLTTTVTVLTGTINVFNNRTSALVATIPVPSSNVTGFGTSTITTSISPNLWPDGRTLTVVVSSGSWQDTHGNAFAGLPFGLWHFTIVDTTPPQITALVPANGGTGHHPAGGLFMTFDENVKVVTSATGSLRVYYSNGTLVTSVACSATSASFSGSGTATIGALLPVRLRDLTNYYVLVSPTCIADLSDNLWPGYSLGTDWAFQTGDFTPPQIISHIPAHLATNVPVTTSLTINFDEVALLGSPSSGVAYYRVVRESDGAMVRVIPAASAAGYGTTTVTVPLISSLYNNEPLPDSVRYCVVIDADVVKDAYGNSYPGLTGGCSVWAFTTEDKTPPMVSSLIPIVGEPRASLIGPLVIQFNEPAYVLSSLGGSILITNKLTSATITTIPTSNTTAFTGNGTTTISISLPLTLPEGVLCTVTVSTGTTSAFSDLSGNLFQGFGTGLPYSHPGWNFTTGDFSPPLLQSLQPQPLETRVDIITPLVLVFNEAIIPMTQTENVQQGYSPDANRLIEVRRVADDAALQLLDASDPAVAGQPNTTSIIIVPPSDLPPSTEIYVVVGSQSVRDLQGNRFAGLPAKRWNFTTETPPLFTYAYPNHTVYADGSRMLSNRPAVASMPLGGPPRSWAICPCDLPAGVTFDTTTGVFRGYPSEARPLQTYTVTARNGGGTYSQTVNLTVLEKPPYSLSYVIPDEPTLSDADTNNNYRFLDEPTNPSFHGYDLRLSSSTSSSQLDAIHSSSASSGMTRYTEAEMSTFIKTAMAYRQHRDALTRQSLSTLQSVLPYDLSSSSLTSSEYVNYDDITSTPMLGFGLTSVPTATYYTNVPITPIPPIVSPLGGPITHYSSSPALPTGLILNPTTGYISGTPRRASPSGAITYNITGSNGGGSVWTQIAIDVKQGVINFGISELTSSSTRTLLQTFLDSVVSPSTSPVLPTDPAMLSFKVVPVGALNDIPALDNYQADIIVTDAFTAYMAARRQQYRLLAVGLVNPGSSYPSPSLSTALPSIDAVALVRRGTFTTFLQLEGRRACTGSSTSNIALSIMQWARLQSTASVKLQSILTSRGMLDPWPTGKPYDACDSPMVAMLDSFFQRTCAPPRELTGTGRCTICPSIKQQDCSSRNPFGDDTGALRGLLEGVCDVAFVHGNTLQATCMPRSGYTPPTWCHSGTSYENIEVLPEMLIVSKVAPTIPSRGLLIRGDTFADATALRLQSALINYWHTQTTYQSLLTLFGSGTARLTTPDLLPPGDPSSQGALALATTMAHFTQGSFSLAVTQLAGVNASISCATAGSCVQPFAESNCNNTRIGTAADPIRFGVARILNTTETFLLSNFLSAATSFITLRAGLAEPAETSSTINSGSTPTWSGSTAAGGLQASSILDLHRGLVDVLSVDSGNAVFAALRLGHVVFAVERSTSPSSAAVSVVGLYRKTDSSGQDVPGPFPLETTSVSLSSFRGLRSCHASMNHVTGLLLSSYFSASRGVFTTADLSHSIPEAQNIADGCEGPLVAAHRSFYKGSCAPPLTRLDPGICDLCDSATPCDRRNRYAGESGALRGLAERACSIAFVKNTTYNNVCGQGMNTPASLASIAGYNPGRPDWCDLIPSGSLAVATDLASVQASLSAPSDVFIIRRGSLTPEGADTLHSTLMAMNTQPALLATVSVNGGLAGIADPSGTGGPGSEEATVSTLQTMEDMFVGFLPGFSNFLACHGRSVAVPDFTTPYCHSIPPTNCSGYAPTSSATFASPQSILVIMTVLLSVVLALFH